MGFGREEYIQASGINISRSGMLCTTEPEISPSSRVYLSFTLPDGVRISCDGFVVRTQSHGKENEVAINFVEFPEDDAAKLVEFFDRWEREQETKEETKKHAAG